MFIFSVMNEVKVVFSDSEMVCRLRELGGIVEERRVEKWSGNESYHVQIWQIRKGDGTWTDAKPLYMQLLDMGVGRAISGNVSPLDLLNLIK